MKRVADLRNELEYLHALIDGHARIFWQTLPRDNPDAAAVPELVKDALYRAVAQALRERVGIPLPPNRDQLENILRAARRSASPVDSSGTPPEST